MSFNPWLLLAAAWVSAGAGAAPAAPKAPPPPAPFEARVVGVVDGATLRVRTPERDETVLRLRHIDAPEPCQPGAEGSKQTLIDWALGQSVTVRAAGRDAQGRTLADVQLGGTDLATRLVEEGRAFSVRSRSDRGPLVKQERMARALGRGLHGEAGGLSPAAWRKQNGPCQAAR